MNETANRKSWMSLLAKVPAGALAKAWRDWGREPTYEWLRTPESGSVMVRGRLGGDGAPFNLGEMTVTRCTLKTENGQVGHGYVQGRDKDKARIAALIDALMQSGERRQVAEAILTPLEAIMTSAREARARKAGATKVDFFTMVRGENK